MIYKGTDVAVLVVGGGGGWRSTGDHVGSVVVGSCDEFPFGSHGCQVLQVANFSCRFSRFGVGGRTDEGLMVSLYREEGPFQEVGEMFLGEVDGKQFSPEDCPFKL